MRWRGERGRGVRGRGVAALLAVEELEPVAVVRGRAPVGRLSVVGVRERERLTGEREVLTGVVEPELDLPGLEGR